MICFLNFLEHNTWISEWIQALGVLVSSVGLFITFREQRKITLIEQKNFLQKYLPILEVKKRDLKELGGVGLDYFFEIFDVVIKENYLQNLSVMHDFPDNHLENENRPYSIRISEIIPNVIFSKGYSITFELNRSVSSAFLNYEDESYGYSGNVIYFNFEDPLGNEYEQQLICKGHSNLFLQPAKLKKEKKTLIKLLGF